MHDGNDVGKGKIIKNIYANICDAILVFTFKQHLAGAYFGLSVTNVL